MRSLIPFSILAFSIFARLSGAVGMVADTVTVGQNLQAIASLSLDAPAPTGGLLISVTSDDPSRLLLSTAPDRAGTPRITLPVRAGFRGALEFCVQGLDKSGTVTYTASAPGIESKTGTVKLAPSGIVFAQSTFGFPAVRTTIGAGKSKITLYSAILDASLNYLAPQPVAAGLSVSAEVTSSNPKVGRITTSPVTIAGGSYTAITHFEPAGVGDTTLAVSLPQGFSKPATFASMPATVITPGIAIADGLTIGRNLEVEWVVHLGEAAPPGGVTITLTSSDAGKLILSTTATGPGLPSIQITIPPGGVGASYYLQALGDSGTVTHAATAPGYLNRVGTITLTQSGVVIGGQQGPPDEAELFRDEVAKGPHGFVASMAAPHATPVYVYLVQLDPVTHRGADLTVQRLRAGLSVVVGLANTNPAVGALADSQLTIKGGESTAATRFTPLAPGVTVISVTTPEKFTQAANSTALTAKVNP